MKKNYIAPTIKVLHMNAVVILAGSTTGTSVYGDRSATPEYDCLAKRHSIWDEDVIKEE